MNMEEADEEANTEPWGWTAFLTSNLFYEIYTESLDCVTYRVSHALKRLNICLGSVSLVTDLLI